MRTMTSVTTSAIDMKIVSKSYPILQKAASLEDMVTTE